MNTVIVLEGLQCCKILLGGKKKFIMTTVRARYFNVALHYDLYPIFSTLYKTFVNFILFLWNSWFTKLNVPQYLSQSDNLRFHINASGLFQFLISTQVFLGIKIITLTKLNYMFKCKICLYSSYLRIVQFLQCPK